MIREIDIQQAQEIKTLLQKQFMDTAPNDFNWDIANKMELIDRMVSNLQKAPLSYRPAPPEDIKANFYTAICDKCGWWGSSKLLDGGGQIADTGDYADCYCPVCGNADTGEVEEDKPEPPKNRKKCIISRYDETITKPPYLTIPIDSIEVTQPENDHLGEEFAGILMRACSHKGYTFRFYTMSTEEGSDYNIVVF